ncbi:MULTISPECIES: glycosyltransferase family 2 protein [Flavobacterium]|uniref:Glycosyltransferase n=1 Tax=Flavobacterium endoglycinae TaxID=2816357 RepID=A0ABX7Q938_9FLAO|nr:MULTISPECIES: glycosyltransferase family 2 protein [Flavobacterium]QSW87457.1 glycosyltransferase [Flavobacterium endoglycinae]
MESISPLISIVTVVFNCEKTIENTILSVVNQDFENYEFIIIDGGSTDNTVAIVEKYKDKITRWISEPDKGIYDAMNKGARMAKGEWINFMNAGDEFAIHNFDSLQEVMKDEKCGIIYGDVIIKKEDDSLFVDVARPLDQINYLLNFCHQSSFVRTKLLVETPFSLDYKISSDYDFFLKMFKKGYKFEYINESISTFALGGISTGISKQYLKERVSIIVNVHFPLSAKILYLFKFLKTLVPVNFTNSKTIN